MNNPMSSQGIVERILKNQSKNVLSALIVVLGIICVVLIPLAIWGKYEFLVIIFSILLCLVLIFILFFFAYFAVKDPGRLHSEDHVLKMTGLALGKKGARYVQNEAIFETASKNLKNITGGALESANGQNNKTLSSPNDENA